MINSSCLMVERRCWSGELLQAAGGSKMDPLMMGLFTGETRSNLGEYEGDTGPQVVNRRSFEILGRQLRISGQPKMISDLAQAHGHPETGLPAKKEILWMWPGNSFCVSFGGLSVLGG